MHTESSNARRGNQSRPPFRRRRNRHPGLAEREAPKKIPQPKGEIPECFAETVFGSLNPLLQHAVAEAEYTAPTPIQEKAIPHLLEGRDLLGCAQTGTGKTAAFLLPILHRLAANPKEAESGRPRAIILAPTRELAAQIATSVTTYGRFIGTSFAVVFGGVSQRPQVDALRRGAALVVATPGRLLDLMEQGHLTLEAIEEFVLDEADRMLDMGFLPDIKRIISALPEERHTQFFSATLSPEVMRLAMKIVKEPVHVTISPDKPTVDKINQRLMFVDRANKDLLLTNLLSLHPEYEKVIVFSRTRHGSDRIVRKLVQAGIPAESIHSDKTQRMRTETLAAFRRGRIRVLVATDIASRGIDVDGITHVFNFDLPEETESYIHRIGRTARAGADGAAISLVCAEERGLLRAIERMIRKEIEIDRSHEFHSEKAERAAGKASADGALPRPPWADKKRQHPADVKRRNSRPPSNRGRDEADFRRRPEDELDLPPREKRAARPPRKEHPVREERPAPADKPPRDERPARNDDKPPRKERPAKVSPASALPPAQEMPASAASAPKFVPRWFDEPFKKQVERQARREAESAYATSSRHREDRDAGRPGRGRDDTDDRGRPARPSRFDDASRQHPSGKRPPRGAFGSKPRSGGGYDASRPGGGGFSTPRSSGGFGSSRSGGGKPGFRKGGPKHGGGKPSGGARGGGSRGGYRPPWE